MLTRRKINRFGSLLMVHRQEYPKQTSVQTNTNPVRYFFAARMVQVRKKQKKARFKRAFLIQVFPEGNDVLLGSKIGNVLGHWITSARFGLIPAEIEKCGGDLFFLPLGIQWAIP